MNLNKDIKHRRVVIISAPSGSGKSTLIRHLLEQCSQLEFSVSATSRAPRGEEENGREYYFLSNTEFAERIRLDAFVEWEEVYRGTYYGTLKSELERIWDKGHQILFDVDVKGGLRLKQIFGTQALAVFIQPPSLEVLRQRLEARGTDTPESIRKRIDRAQEEISYAPRFDRLIVNDDLAEAQKQIEEVVSGFLCKPM